MYIREKEKGEKLKKRELKNKEFPISNAVRVKKEGKWRT
jgi:hypothetical protein